MTPRLAVAHPSELSTIMWLLARMKYLPSHDWIILALKVRGIEWV